MSTLTVSIMVSPNVPGPAAFTSRRRFGQGVSSPATSSVPEGRHECFEVGNFINMINLTGRAAGFVMALGR